MFHGKYGYVERLIVGGFSDRWIIRFSAADPDTQKTSPIGNPGAGLAWPICFILLNLYFLSLHKEQHSYLASRYCLYTMCISQMQHAVLDLLCSALVPELGPDISTCPAGYVHLVLILVPAVGAFPHEFSFLVLHDLDLAVKAAAFAVVALGVKLRVHDVLINMLHDSQHRRDIILHVGNFHIT